MHNYDEERPISPHLSIHRKLLTAVFSIFHRITGFALTIGNIFIVLWILFFSLGEEYFNVINNLTQYLLIKIILFLWTFGLLFHSLNGIRYLVWSLSYGINIKNIYITSYLVIVFSLLSTILIWLIV